MEQRMHKVYHIMWVLLPYLGLAVWGALCVTNNLWYDEAYTAALISHPLRELVQITSQDVHAPFYYILLKGFYALCGGGTRYRFLKLFSLLMMFAYMLMGKYGVKRLYDEQTSVYFMLFSVLMPSMCVQAGNARMYAMGMRQIVSPKVKAVVLAVFLLCFVPQYRSELELEYDSGLQEYEAFYEGNVGPEDMIMAAGIHPLLLSVYHPQRQYMAYGYLPPFSPFQNTTVFTQWEQLEDVAGDIWLYGFAGRDMPGFSPYYNLEPAFQFHYMYYDFVIYRLVPAEPIG